MTVKDDEILVVKTILNKCKKPGDMIPTEDILNLNINKKRLYYLLNKLTWFIESGVSVYHGWINWDCSISQIKDYYKTKHRVIFT